MYKPFNTKINPNALQTLLQHRRGTGFLIPHLAEKKRIIFLKMTIHLKCKTIHVSLEERQM